MARTPYFKKRKVRGADKFNWSVFNYSIVLVVSGCGRIFAGKLYSLDVVRLLYLLQPHVVQGTEEKSGLLLAFWLES